MAEQRLPTVSGDDGIWGTLLNQFLSKEHYNTGLDNAANGGHTNVTIRAGTATAGTAPLKLTSGTLLTTPEVGAIEFNNNRLYYTQTTSATRKVIAAFDDTSGATGDIYYRNASGDIVRLAIGGVSQVLGAAAGVPGWATPDKTSVGLSNVDNTSDTAKNAATATLTNKTITAPVLSGSVTGTYTLAGTPTFPSTVVSTTGTQTLTNKTLTAPVLGGSITGTYTLAGTPTFPATVVSTTGTQTLTNKTLSTGSVIDANVTVTEVLRKVYPVGSIYISTASTDPATLFGFGTWAAFAAGRTLVGVGTSDQAFAAAATGGASTHTLSVTEMPSHNHGITGVGSILNLTGNGTGGATISSGTGVSTTAISNNGSGGAHNNLQPYIVTYMWQRTA